MSRIVVIAPDKFKGTLTAAAAAKAIARGWRRVCRHDELDLLPITDGGDGFGEIISKLMGARRLTIKTVNAAHRACKANWWWHTRSKTAIVESANVIGLAMLPRGKFHPFDLDTIGLGKVLLAARAAGAKRIIIGIGGSATNDGGFGMARALGWKFFNARGSEIEQWTALATLSRVEPPKPSPLAGVKILVAVDVNNRLLGAKGATRVYGPQKGLLPEQFVVVEKCLRKLAAEMKCVRGRDFSIVPGSGAAGGLAFGLMTFARAQPRPGFEMMAKLARVSARLRRADIVVTGEGAFDHSTLMGKGAGEIARRCRELDVPCVGLAGMIAPKCGIEKIFKRARALTELTSEVQAKARPAFWLERLATEMATEMKSQT